LKMFFEYVMKVVVIVLAIHELKLISN